MFGNRRRFVVAVAASVFARRVGPARGAVQAPATTSAPSAGQILARMLKTYAEARSYADEGEVVLVFVGPKEKRTVKKPFSTRFVRPRRYRYEFSERVGDGADERRRFVIWSDAAPEQAKRWWTIKPEIKEESLQMAVAGATGVSSGSAVAVPALLMPDAIRANSLANLKDLRLVGEEVVDGGPCFKIEGKFARGEARTIWIDKKEFLLKKIQSSNKISGATVERTVTYRPRVDVAIPPEAFEFTPPKT